MVFYSYGCDTLKNNACYTYFTIKGNFNPDDISVMLQLQPYKTHKIGTLRKNGTEHESACWSFGRCNNYDVYVENQMEKTIEPLLNKIDILNEIRNKFDVSFYLVIVPTIYANSIKPCLAPSLKIIDFCHFTRTNIDIDLYVINEEEE